jgi:hypothetical protein
MTKQAFVSSMDKTKMIELKPCPFCGAQANGLKKAVSMVTGSVVYRWVDCDHSRWCPMTYPDDIRLTGDEIQECWNRRVGDVLDELCEQCNDHLGQGDWVTIDDRKLCSLCAYAHEKDKIKEEKR